MTTPVTFDSVRVEPGALRLGDEMLPLRLVTADPTTDVAAEVTWRGVGYRLRAWTFRERRRLLVAHLTADGELDVAALAAAALAVLVRPVPTETQDREVVGLAALAWSATAGARTPAPTPGVDPATQTVTLAAATGWRPGDIDGAPAADVDHWFAAVPSSAGPVAAAPRATDDPTFRSFRLED
ncbi:hypothetical protein [Frankia sp. QA3]|uniref:hypothetical protein n=1 Tax=Frankia sp. QA3 TaxID=710111 RepID=UPI000269BC87|nr:hypothetical protein [Frankia sp. QA3]EIV92701.1 hypothetical protein FraQA3DRAFT_2311 [Frankia sp. QA3]